MREIRCGFQNTQYRRKGIVFFVSLQLLSTVLQNVSLHNSCGGIYKRWKKSIISFYYCTGDHARFNFTSNFWMCFYIDLLSNITFLVYQILNKWSCESDHVIKFYNIWVVNLNIVRVRTARTEWCIISHAIHNS